VKLHLLWKLALRIPCAYGELSLKTGRGLRRAAPR